MLAMGSSTRETRLYQSFFEILRSMFKRSAYGIGVFCVESFKNELVLVDLSKKPLITGQM